MQVPDAPRKGFRQYYDASTNKWESKKDPMTIFIRTLEMVNDLEFNTFSIEIETNNEIYTLQKANGMMWELKTDNTVKFIKYIHIVTWIYSENIQRISLLKPNQDFYNYFTVF